ncbi:hypothetical protein ACHAXM_009784 [Skeletonema potamos]
MQLRLIYILTFLFMSSRISAFGGRLLVYRRQQEQKAFHLHSAAVGHNCETASKDEDATRANLGPYFSIYYNGESSEKNNETIIFRSFYPIFSNFCPHEISPHILSDVWEVDMPPGHRFPMSKYKKVRKAVQAYIHNSEQQIQCDFRVSPLATFEQLSTTHCSDYISRYLSGKMTAEENRNIGFPWTMQHVNRTLSSAGGTVAAACDAYEEYVRRCNAIALDHGLKRQYDNRQTDYAHLCWSAHVAGGTHHAFRDYGEGFCIFSDIAVAANVLLQKFPYQPSTATPTSSKGIRRILIIDLDVHQGNGNAALFQGNDKVQTFSVHCRSNYFSKKEKSDLDIELPPLCTDETYLTTLKHWLRRIEEHPFDDNDQLEKQGQKPFDFIFYQAGVDIHKDDRLGRLSITQEGISKRNHLVFDFAHRMRAPLVICMGGGYPKGDDWTPILTAHAGVYIEAYQYLSSFV